MGKESPEYLLIDGLFFLKFGWKLIELERRKDRCFFPWIINNFSDSIN